MKQLYQQQHIKKNKKKIIVCTNRARDLKNLEKNRWDVLPLPKIHKPDVYSYIILSSIVYWIPSIIGRKGGLIWKTLSEKIHSASRRRSVNELQCPLLVHQCAYKRVLRKKKTILKTKWEHSGTTME